MKFSELNNLINYLKKNNLWKENLTFKDVQHLLPKFIRR